jgi:hypothetical protein
MLAALISQKAIPMKPEIIQVPALDGLRWLQLGVSTLWRRYWTCLLLIALQACHIALSRRLSPAPDSLLMGLAPFFSLAAILTAARVRAGQQIGPDTQRTAYGRKWLLPMLALGALYALINYLASPLVYLALLHSGIDWPKVVYELSLRTDMALILLLAPTPWLIHRYGVSATTALRLIAAAYLRNWRAFALFTLGLVVLAAVLLVAAMSAAIGFKLADIEGVGLKDNLHIAAQVWFMVLLFSNFFMLRDCFAAKSPELADIGLRTA